MKDAVISINASFGKGKEANMNSREYFDTVAKERDLMRMGFFSEPVRESAFAAAGILK